MSKQTPSQGTAESKKEPMPPPYTDVPNGMPVGVWMPGRYHNPDHMEWRDKQDGKAPKPQDTSIQIELTDARRWNGGYGRTIKEERICAVKSCQKPFIPKGPKQRTCGSEECRKKRKSETTAEWFRRSKKAVA